MSLWRGAVRKVLWKTRSERDDPSTDSDPGTEHPEPRFWDIRTPAERRQSKVRDVFGRYNADCDFDRAMLTEASLGNLQDVSGFGAYSTPLDTPVIESLLDSLQPGAIVINLGCGILPGFLNNLTLAVASRQPNASVEFVDSVFPPFDPVGGLKQAVPARFRSVDALRLAEHYAPNSVDFILALGFFGGLYDYHNEPTLRQWLDALDQISIVLKNSGCVVVSNSVTRQPFQLFEALVALAGLSATLVPHGADSMPDEATSYPRYLAILRLSREIPKC